MSSEAWLQLIITLAATIPEAAKVIRGLIEGDPETTQRVRDVLHTPSHIAEYIKEHEHDTDAK